MKQLKYILIFLGIFFIGQWIITYSFDKLNSKSSFRFSKIYSEKEQMNNSIVCIGNSRGVNSFYAPYIQKKYNIPSFNLSYNGMSMPLANLFLNDYLDHHKKPKIVFLEVSNLFVSDSKVNFSTYNLYSNKSERLHKEIKKNNYNTYLLTSIFPLYRYNSELFYRSLFYSNKTDQDWINRYKISKSLENEINNEKAFNIEIIQKDILILKKLVQQLKSKGIDVILFVAPYHPRYKLKIKNLESAIKSIESKVNHRVYDISSLINQSDYFADRVHTNEKGAISISDTLIQMTKLKSILQLKQKQ